MPAAQRSLHALTFLAPNMESVYRAVLEYASRRLSIPITLVAGVRYEEAFAADLSFICGLPYVLRTSPRLVAAPLIAAPLIAIAAPVLRDERYDGKPIYFSDVIVHRDSPYRTFSDLRGASWVYNEPESQSGYGITRYTMVQRGLTGGFFGKVIEAGYHQTAIRMVCDRTADASAIDSQVLAVELRDHPELAGQLRVIDSFGPSTIQPLAVSSEFPPHLQDDLRQVLIHIHTDPTVSAWLERGFIERFVAVQDSDYDDIRAMLTACEKANFLTIR